MAVTWNPADKSSGLTLSSGNLTATGPSSGESSARATEGKATGKWYYEDRWDTPPQVDSYVGFSTLTSPFSLFASQMTSYFPRYGDFIKDGNFEYGSQNRVAGGFVVGACVDAGTRKCWFSFNGTWIDGNPAAGTGGHLISGSGAIFPRTQLLQSTATARFLSSSQSYPAPSGFFSWETSSAPAAKILIGTTPTIAIKLGTTDITKVYLGSTQIWP